MSVDALIGYSGFVGGVLSQQHPFTNQFNTSNIDGIGGLQFHTLVCAAAPGSMYTANREPDRDRAQIDALITQLGKVKARNFILISSIAVLADLAAGYDETTQAFQKNRPYGLNRRRLELFCETHFSNCLIVRLPALFGPGLRKNFIFDLLNPVPSMLTQEKLETLLEKLPLPLRGTLAHLYSFDASGMYVINRDALNKNSCRSALEAAVLSLKLSAAQFHNPDTTYQYYDLSKLWRDIQVASKNKLRILHLATEPLRAGNIYLRLLGSEMPNSDAQLHREDMQTQHAAFWGRDSRYLEDSGTVLEKLEAFFVAQCGAP